MIIDNKLVFKKEGDKSASEFLNDFIKEKAKNIKLNVPFEASGTFEKTPLQPDGITPIVVNEPNFSGGKGVEIKEVKEEKLEDKVTEKKEVKVEPKKTKKKTTKK